MLSKFFLRAAVTAAALTCSTGSASAENFDIMIAEFSFFPSISYVQPGDTITFINESGATRQIRSSNNDWVIPSLGDGAQISINIEENWKNDFLSRLDNATSQSEIGTDLKNADLSQEAGTIAGVLSFGQPPVEAVADDS